MSVPILECVDVHAAYGRIEVLRGVFAFMGKSVRGRLTVLFRSGREASMER